MSWLLNAAERYAAEDNASVPYPAGRTVLPGCRRPRARIGTQQNARRNLFDRAADPRVLAALTSASKASEDSSLEQKPALRPLPDLPPSPLRSAFRGVRPTFQPTHPCGSVNLRVDLAPFPSKPLTRCRSRLPLRARQNLGPASPARKWLIHQFSVPGLQFSHLSTSCQQTT